MSVTFELGGLALLETVDKGPLRGRQRPAVLEHARLDDVAMRLGRVRVNVVHVDAERLATVRTLFVWCSINNMF